MTPSAGPTAVLALAMPLELKHPVGLWLLVLLVPLVLLYLLKVRRERRRVGSTVLWRMAKRDLLAEHPFKRLVPEIPLIAQALAIALLSLALAQPTSRAALVGGDHVAIVIDTSASMGARSGSRTRMDEARTAARGVIRSLAPGADAIVIAAGREPKTVCPLDRDRARLSAAIDALGAGDVEGRMSEAVAIAAERMRSLGGMRKIVLVTDGASDDTGALATSNVPLEIVHVGAPIDNTGIIRVDVRASREPGSEREQLQVFALVAHHGSHRRDVFITLRQRNVSEPLSSRKLSLEPGQRAPVVLAFEPAPSDAGTGLVVELSPSDALVADDRAYARVPISRHLPVVLVPADANPWVRRALAADPDVDVLGAKLGELATADVPNDALVVCDGFCPTAVAGSDLLVLNPPAGACRTANVGATIDAVHLTSWSEQDPRLRFLNLDGVQIARSRLVTALGDRESLVRAREGTLIADISVAGHTGTLIGFDVGESNWPLKSSFVMFVRNLVELARSHRSDSSLGPGRTGEAIRASVPSDVAWVHAIDPSGREERLPAHDGLVVLPGSERAGFFYLSWDGKHAGSSLTVANLLSDHESDPNPRPAAQPATASGPSGTPRPPESVTSYAWIAAALALFVLAFDAWWLTRTRRRFGLVLERSPAKVRP